MNNKQRAVYEMIRGECYRFLAACFYLPKKKPLALTPFSCLDQQSSTGLP